MWFQDQVMNARKCFHLVTDSLEVPPLLTDIIVVEVVVSSSALFPFSPLDPLFHPLGGFSRGNKYATIVCLLLVQQIWHWTPRVFLTHYDSLLYIPFFPSEYQEDCSLRILIESVQDCMAGRMFFSSMITVSVFCFAWEVW